MKKSLVAVAFLAFLPLNLGLHAETNDEVALSNATRLMQTIWVTNGTCSVQPSSEGEAYLDNLVDYIMSFDDPDGQIVDRVKRETMTEMLAEVDRIGQNAFCQVMPMRITETLQFSIYGEF